MDQIEILKQNVREAKKAADIADKANSTGMAYDNAIGTRYALSQAEEKLRKALGKA